MSRNMNTRFFAEFLVVLSVQVNPCPGIEPDDDCIPLVQDFQRKNGKLPHNNSTLSLHSRILDLTYVPSVPPAPGGGEGEKKKEKKEEKDGEEKEEDETKGGGKKAGEEDEEDGQRDSKEKEDIADKVRYCRGCVTLKGWHRNDL